MPSVALRTLLTSAALAQQVSSSVPTKASTSQTVALQKPPSPISSGTAQPQRDAVPYFVQVLSLVCLQITSCPGHWQPLSAQRGCRMHTENTFPIIQVRHGSAGEGLRWARGGISRKQQGERPGLRATTKA